MKTKQAFGACAWESSGYCRSAGLEFSDGMRHTESKPQPLHGCGSGWALGGRPGGRHQSQQSLEGCGYRRVARSWRGWRGRSTLRAVANPLSAATAGGLSASNSRGIISSPSRVLISSSRLYRAAARLSSRLAANRMPPADRLRSVEKPWRVNLARAFLMGKMGKNLTGQAGAIRCRPAGPAPCRLTAGLPPRPRAGSPG